MRIKAIVSFAGMITMNIGEVREVEEKLASSLISCGYAVEITEAGDADEDIGNNGRRRKKGVKD